MILVTSNSPNAWNVSDFVDHWDLTALSLVWNMHFNAKVIYSCKTDRTLRLLLQGLSHVLSLNSSLTYSFHHFIIPPLFTITDHVDVLDQHLVIRGANPSTDATNATAQHRYCGIAPADTVLITHVTNWKKNTFNIAAEILLGRLLFICCTFLPDL